MIRDRAPTPIAQFLHLVKVLISLDLRYLALTTVPEFNLEIDND